MRVTEPAWMIRTSRPSVSTVSASGGSLSGTIRRTRSSCRIPSTEHAKKTGAVFVREHLEHQRFAVTHFRRPQGPPSPRRSGGLLRLDARRWLRRVRAAHLRRTDSRGRLFGPCAAQVLGRPWRAGFGGRLRANMDCEHVATSDQAARVIQRLLAMR